MATTTTTATTTGNHARAKGGWVPTRKWIALLVTGLITIAIHWIASGGWDKTEWGELLTLASGLVWTYLVPNEAQPTGTGVPPAATR